MTIEVLNQEMIKAMKEKDTIARDTIRTIIGNIKKASIDKRCEITEALCDEVLLKEVKTINEMIDTCPPERMDLLEEYAYKKMIICKYAPQRITDEPTIRNMIKNILLDITIVDKGQVMKFVMPKLKGKVDMKIANKIIGEMFSGK